MKYDNNTKTIKHLSLCSGYEGIGLGLRRVLPNVREIGYCEIEACAIANLCSKIEEGKLDKAPIFTNLKTLPFESFLGKVDILSGGFPCTPFSQAGAKKSDRDPRHLFPYIERGIELCRPSAVFFENVYGIISRKTKDGEPVLKYVLRRLEELGYRAEAGIFSAREVGLPHKRLRVFIYAISNSDSFGRRRRDSSSESDMESNWSGGNESKESRKKVRSEAERCGGEPRELSNSSSERGEVSPQGRLTSEQVFNCVGTERIAQPNQPQYQWEKPRAIAVESRLGGATDGTPSRLDRIRLCGNGVVPQTVAKAFITLSQRLL